MIESNVICPTLRTTYRNHFAERCVMQFSCRPQHRIAWGCCRKDAAHIGKKDKRLWRDSLLFQPAKTGAEVGSTASLRSELYGLTRLVGFDLISSRHSHTDRFMPRRLLPR